MQNPFGNILEFFKHAVQPGGESVIGVDFGSAYLKVVQLRRKAGKAILETYGELALGPYANLEIGRATRLSHDKLSEALRDVLREAHVTASPRAGTAIPFSSSLVTLIDMPLLGENELAAAIPIEARKYVPVPISEVNLDWWAVPPEPSVRNESAPAPQPAKTEVLIVAIHNEAITRFTEALRGASLEPAFFEVELFSTIRALFREDLDTHAILDLGAGETKLYIIDRGLLRLSHIINQGAQDLTLALSHSLAIGVAEAEALKREQGLNGDTGTSLKGLLDYVSSEVHRGLRSFSQRTARPVKDLTLTGGGANLLGLPAYMEGTIGLPVRRADPFSGVEAPAFLDEVLKAVGPEFSVALGAAFRKLQMSS